MEEKSTPKALARACMDAFNFAADAFSDARGFSILLEHFGWWVEESIIEDAILQDFSGLVGSVRELVAKAQDVIEAEINREIEHFTELAAIATDVFHELRRVKDLPFPGLPSFLDEDSFKEILHGILDYAFILNLELDHPLIYSILKTIGIIEVAESEYDRNNPYRFHNLKRRVNWENLRNLFTDPTQLARDVYSWQNIQGEAPFEHKKLLDNLYDLAVALNIDSGIHTPDAVFKNIYYGGETSWEDVPHWLRIHFFEGYDAAFDAWVDVGILLFPIPAESSSLIPGGLSIVPYVKGRAGQEFELTPPWRFKLGGEFSTGSQVGVELFPDRIEFLNDLSSGTEAKARAEIAGDFANPLMILGSEGGSRFQVGRIQVAFEAEIRDLQDTDIALELTLDEAAVCIRAGEGDGFLQKILPAEPFQTQFKLTVGLSKHKGMYFKGGANEGSGLRYVSQVNRSLGPITISAVDFKAGPENERDFLLAVSSSIKASLGPLKAVIDGVGLQLLLEPNKPGILGNGDLSFKFKPPAGIGFSLDAEMVSGGGFLRIEDGDYAGILELDLQNRISITAIALLTTKTPDNSRAFSLLILGSTDFSPIQLGLGFFISGIGLAVAIERHMNGEALRKAVYNGSLRSLLFPANPVQNAQQIITDLKSFFPPRDDYYVFGAMARLGWGGAAPLITADVGIFVEIGDALRVVLAGIAEAVLPNENTRVIYLQLQVIGVLDFGSNTLAIDSSLTGSKLLAWSLDGDIALRSSWGDNPRFALSAGGFFPGYRVPAGFPDLQRLSITLGTGNPRVGLFLYLAATENSIQFGAALLFHWEKRIKLSFIDLGLIEVDGGLTFDALFQFNPFCFESKLAGWLDLKRNGSSLMAIEIRLNLTGPNNYRAWGYGRAEVCGVNVEVEFDRTFGKKKPELPPDVGSPLEAMRKELQESKNWRVFSPFGGAKGVVFREELDDNTLLDPFGGIAFRQRAVPLKMEIHKFGQALVPENETYLDLKPAAGDSYQDSEDFFAPNEFLNLSDQEKVSAPAFEKMKSGLEFFSGDMAVPGEHLHTMEIEYLTKIEERPRFFSLLDRVAGRLNAAVLLRVQKLAGRKVHNPRRIRPFAEKAAGITVGEDKFTVVTGQAVNGRFARAAMMQDGELRQVENLTFTQARQARHKVGTDEAEIINTARAVLKEGEDGR